MRQERAQAVISGGISSSMKKRTSTKVTFEEGSILNDMVSRNELIEGEIGVEPSVRGLCIGAVFAWLRDSQLYFRGEMGVVFSMCIMHMQWPWSCRHTEEFILPPSMHHCMQNVLNPWTKMSHLLIVWNLQHIIS